MRTTVKSRSPEGNWSVEFSLADVISGIRQPEEGSTLSIHTKFVALSDENGLHAWYPTDYSGPLVLKHRDGVTATTVERNSSTWLIKTAGNPENTLEQHLWAINAKEVKLIFGRLVPASGNRLLNFFINQLIKFGANEPLVRFEPAE